MIKLHTDSWITHIECSEANEFVGVLDPVAGLFQQRSPFGPFMFRGVSSTSYDLSPSAFRRAAWLIDGQTFVRAPRPTALDQCRAELDTIGRFFDIAARQGVRLPEDSQTLRTELDQWRLRLGYSFVSKFEPFVWPPPQFYSLIALAQHYNVPTRALDWSWNALTAAYFAARGVAPSSRRRIVVWVYNDTARKVVDVLSTGRSGKPRPFVIFTAPGADNDNLRAQKGAFMLFAQRVTSDTEPFVPATYDKLLRKSFAVTEGGRILLRVTVPATKALPVLAMLSVAGVSAASLFPGLWGVARELEEQRLLEDQFADLQQQPEMSRLAKMLAKNEMSRLDRT